MAKDFKKVELEKVEKVETPKTDFVQLVKDAVPSMGSSLFTRVNLKQHVTDAGLENLNEVFAKEGYEVFSSGKSVLLLKQ